MARRAPNVDRAIEIEIVDILIGVCTEKLKLEISVIQRLS
jgi:hypothetical protein